MKRMSGGKRTCPGGSISARDVVVLRRGGEDMQFLPAETAGRRVAVAAPSARAAAIASGTICQRSPVCLGQAGRTREARARRLALQAATALRGNIRCIGMRGIDHRVDSLGAQPLREAVHAAEAADAGGDRLRLGVDRAAGQRQDRVEAPVAVRLSPAISRASSEASVVPPRMRTRMCSAPIRRI